MTDTQLTSHEAAVAIAPVAPIIKERIYDYICSWGSTGCTDERIQLGLGIDGSTERPRRIDLQNEHRIESKGPVGRTSKGFRATVWVAC